MGLHMNEVLNDPKVDDYMVEALKSVPPSTQTRLLTFVDEILAEHNISKEDKVALISNNRLEWATIKYATVGLGGQIVPM